MIGVHHGIPLWSGVFAFSCFTIDPVWYTLFAFDSDGGKKFETTRGV